MSDLNTTALHNEIMQLGFTVNDEKAFIATNLNATMTIGLLMGIYTIILGGTLYVYMMRGVSSRYLVPVTMLILYISNLALLGIQWYSTKWQFVNNGENRDTIFAAIVDTNVGVSTTVNILSAISLVLGDGLLIWRCFHLWNRSFRVILIPMFLTVSEAVAATLSPTAVSLRTRLAKVAAAGILLAGSTTIITTALIAYRIYSFLRHQDISNRKFNHIIDIVVQSGAIYSLSLLCLGLSNVINENIGSIVEFFEFNCWATAITFPLTGISTTIMVARIATLSDDRNPTTSMHLNGIQFRPRSTTWTGTGAQTPVVLSTQGDAARNSAIAADQDLVPDLKGKVIQAA
ncbi:hypothetical protein BDN70DRAFT_937576 [Pholiota conissans]|uniref:Uncharacterized protein n=1 Tax=Pholiota conissans TaxID=109636 RepID=A0A9P5YQI5_9AGAR|nr:hypothetical protein BDN70DRAFT_937576 [Pholiota conissans]